VGEFSSGAIRVGGVVFGVESNDESGDKSEDGTQPSLIGGSEGESIISGEADESGGETELGGEVQNGDQDDGGVDELVFEGSLDTFEAVEFVGEIGGENGHAETGYEGKGADHDGVVDGSGVEIEGSGSGGDDKGGTGGFGERSEEIRSHTGDVSNIISDVIGDGGGVIRGVFSHVFFNLSDKVGSDIGAFGKDTTSDSSEKGHGGSSESVSGDSVIEGGQVFEIFNIPIVIDGDQNHEVQDSGGGQGESQNTSGSVSNLEPGAHGGLAFVCTSIVGKYSDSHSDESSNDGGKSSQ